LESGTEAGWDIETVQVPDEEVPTNVKKVESNEPKKIWKAAT